MSFFKKRKNESNPAIFINCHTDFGGAERRFSRIFNEYLSTKTNVKFITNNSTHNILTNRNLISTRTNTIVLPGGFKNNGLLYKTHHIANFLLLAMTSLLKRITHIHYPVDPSLYSVFHSFFLSPLGITYSLSIVDSSRTKKSDFSHLRHYIWQRSIKHATGIDFLSNGIKENVHSLFPQPSKPKIVGISPCSFTDYTKATYSEVKDYDLVMMCRLHPKKGHDLLFSALRCIRERGEQNKIGRIGIFGAGPLMDELKLEASTFTDFNITFGKTETPINILAKTKFLLSLQEDENYPSQAILEALSTGAKIIATDVGETYRLVTEDVGLRIPRDPDLLASGIIKSIDNYTFDRNIYNTLNSFVTSNHNPTRFGTYLHDLIINSAR
jgi:glycosyltransferase involved in cell wall biosynthesis